MDVKESYRMARWFSGGRVASGTRGGKRSRSQTRARRSGGSSGGGSSGGSSQVQGLSNEQLRAIATRQQNTGETAGQAVKSLGYSGGGGSGGGLSTAELQKLSEIQKANQQTASQALKTAEATGAITPKSTTTQVKQSSQQLPPPEVLSSQEQPQERITPTQNFTPARTFTPAPPQDYKLAPGQSSISRADRTVTFTRPYDPYEDLPTSKKAGLVFPKYFKTSFWRGIAQTATGTGEGSASPRPLKAIGELFTPSQVFFRQKKGDDVIPERVYKGTGIYNPETKKFDVPVDYKATTKFEKLDRDSYKNLYSRQAPQQIVDQAQKEAITQIEPKYKPIVEGYAKEAQSRVNRGEDINVVQKDLDAKIEKLNEQYTKDVELRTQFISGNRLETSRKFRQEYKDLTGLKYNVPAIASTGTAIIGGFVAPQLTAGAIFVEGQGIGYEGIAEKNPVKAGVGFGLSVVGIYSATTIAGDAVTKARIEDSLASKPYKVKNDPGILIGKKSRVDFTRFEQNAGSARVRTNTQSFTDITKEYGGRVADFESTQFSRTYIQTRDFLTNRPLNFRTEQIGVARGFVVKGAGNRGLTVVEYARGQTIQTKASTIYRLGFTKKFGLPENVKVSQSKTYQFSRQVEFNKLRPGSPPEISTIQPTWKDQGIGLGASRVRGNQFQFEYVKEGFKPEAKGTLTFLKPKPGAKDSSFTMFKPSGRSPSTPLSSMYQTSQSGLQSTTQAAPKTITKAPGLAKFVGVGTVTKTTAPAITSTTQKGLVSASSATKVKDKTITKSSQISSQRLQPLSKQRLEVVPAVRPQERIVNRVAQSGASVQRVAQAQKQAQKVAQKEKLKTTLTQGTITTPSPVGIPKPAAPFLFFPKYFNLRRPRTRDIETEPVSFARSPNVYRPGLVSTAYGITGRTPKNKLTGLELRKIQGDVVPYYSSRRKRKKRKGLFNF